MTYSCSLYILYQQFFTCRLFAVLASTVTKTSTSVTAQTGWNSGIHGSLTGSASCTADRSRPPSEAFLQRIAIPVVIVFAEPLLPMLCFENILPYAFVSDDTSEVPDTLVPLSSHQWSTKQSLKCFLAITNMQSLCPQHHSYAPAIISESTTTLQACDNYDQRI
jgi:hypothetical protein